MVHGLELHSYWDDARRYCYQTTRKHGWYILDVYDTGPTWGPVETSAGITVRFPPIATRFIRYAKGRSDKNNGIHWAKIRVYGKDLKLLNLNSAKAILGPFEWANPQHAGGFIDGITERDSWAGAPTIGTNYTDTCGSPDNVPYITVDIGKVARLDAITLFKWWNDVGNATETYRRYCNQRLQLSIDGENWQTVLNTGASWWASESSGGNTVQFRPALARYVRHYLGRNTDNEYVHFIEMKAYGEYRNELDLSQSTVQLEAGKTWSLQHTGGLFDGDISQFAYKKSVGAASVSCTNPAWVTVELPHLAILDSVTLFHYYHDGRAYCNQWVELSTDGSTWQKVYSTGQGYGFSETALGYTIQFEPMDAMFVRHGLGGSDASVANDNHFTEKKMNGRYVKELPLDWANVELSSNVQWPTGILPQRVIDGLNSCDKWAEHAWIDRTPTTPTNTCATNFPQESDLPYLTVDLGRPAMLEAVRVWFYYCTAGRNST
ncbi:Secreted protein [Seminavis robusta]|uniref:Secreted protein n=1 Tax=Seminavis robusta TaxID=568900 RepID=A0A9N8HW63_9STRA|nr:Secreted protein [Seminavis robusta]|eukprot:Sro1605_g285410.1 Secreted protein (491) ;mRNA; r:4656-7283